MSQSKVMCVLPVSVVQPTKYCCVMINQVKKDLNQLNMEAQRLQLLEEEYNKKLEVFLEVSKTVDSKLCYLWSMGSQIASVNYPKCLQVYEFANRMSEAWRDGDEVIAQDIQTVQLISYTSSNVPLNFVLDKIRSASNLVRETIQKITYHVSCVAQFSNLYNQIAPLIARLQDGNIMLRYFLSICKAIPYLKELESIIDQFTDSFSQDIPLETQLPEGNQETETITTMGSKETDEHHNELSAFPKVVQLLTGELLCQDCLDHRSKIEPVVKHETPELPKPIIPKQLPFYAQEMMLDYNTPTMWNNGGVTPVTNRVNDTQVSPVEYFTSYYQNTPWTQKLRNSFGTCCTPESANQSFITKTDMFSPQSNNLECKNIGYSQPSGQNRLMEPIINPALQRKFPDLKLRPNNGMTVNNPNVVSVLLLENTGDENEDLYDNTTVKTGPARRGRPRTKHLTVAAKRKKVTNKARNGAKSDPEVNDLQPIKIPSLKYDLLTPLA